MKIIKANGEETAYKPEKIIRSLERAGASKKVIQEVLTETEKELFDGIHTKAMYKIVYRNLKKISQSTAGKYPSQKCHYGTWTYRVPIGKVYCSHT